jgi:hypothetical protein
MAPATVATYAVTEQDLRGQDGAGIAVIETAHGIADVVHDAGDGGQLGFARGETEPGRILWAMLPTRFAWRKPCSVKPMAPRCSSLLTMKAVTTGSCLIRSNSTQVMP